MPELLVILRKQSSGGGTPALRLPHDLLTSLLLLSPGEVRPVTAKQFALQ